VSDEPSDEGRRSPNKIYKIVTARLEYLIHCMFCSTFENGTLNLKGEKISQEVEWNLDDEFRAKSRTSSYRVGALKKSKKYDQQYE
jgi:hypothetical protein